MSNTCPTCHQDLDIALSDPSFIQTFLGERTVHCRTSRTRTSVLYQDYESWCASRQMRPVSKTMFGRVLDESRYLAARGANGVRMRQGLHLRVQEARD